MPEVHRSNCRRETDWLPDLPAERLSRRGVQLWVGKQQRRLSRWFTVGLIYLAVWADCARAAEPLGRAAPPASTVRLFNGTNLAGFHPWLVDTRRADPRGVFSVTNGWLRISGDGLGYLATDTEYRDYRLRVEFRWGQTNTGWGDRLGKARDSGVFVHATGTDGNSHDGQGAFMAAIECQVMEGAVGDFLLIRGTAADGTVIAPRVVVEAAPELDADGWPYWQPGGATRPLSRWGRINRLGKARSWRDDFGFRDPAERPAGEWNRLEIVCVHDRISVLLNGKLVNEARDVRPNRGRILLQCEGSEIFFRTIELTPAREEP